MWDIAYSVIKDREKVEGYLRDKYEPFAVTADPYGGETIWFRKEVTDALQKQTRTKELFEEVLPKKRGEVKD